MQYSEGRIGRIFVLRLEEGDLLPDAIEDFACDHDLASAMVIYVGGAQDRSRLVVGPEEGHGGRIIPMIHTLQGIQEVLAVGTLFPDEAGNPVLHMHAATGREGGATVGCTRAGVEVWLVGEVVLLEILGTGGRRKEMSETGFKLLELGHTNKRNE
jgi:predicted DNA-binding protein with PD1-like motif